MFVVAGEFQLSLGDPGIREQPPWLSVVQMTLRMIISRWCPGLGTRGQEEKVK